MLQIRSSGPVPLVMIECSSEREVRGIARYDAEAVDAGAGLRELMESVLEAALEAGEVTDAALAESEAQRAAIWRLREEHPEAQKREICMPGAAKE